MSNSVMRPPMSADEKAGYNVGKPVGASMYREGKSESDAKTLPPREAPQGKHKNDWQKGYMLGRRAGWRDEFNDQQKLPPWARMTKPPPSLPPAQIPVKQGTAAPPVPSQAGQRGVSPPAPKQSPPPPSDQSLPHPPPPSHVPPPPWLRPGAQPATSAGARGTSRPAPPPRPSAILSPASSSRGRTTNPVAPPAGQMSHSKSRGSAGQFGPTASPLQTTNLPNAPRKSILNVGPTWSPVSPEKASATIAVQTSRQAPRYISPPRPAAGNQTVQSSPSFERLRAQHEQDEQRKRQESEADFARNGPIQRFGRG